MIFVVLDYYFFQVFKKYNYVNATIYDSKMPQTSIQKHQTKFYHFHEFCNTSIHIEKNLTFENENGQSKSQSTSCLLKWLKRTD